MTAKSLKHKFASAVADGADQTLVRPSNWNDDHNFYVGVNAQTGTSYTVADSDGWTLITYNNAAAAAVTLPQAGASSQFQSGHVTFHRNLGAGVVTITPSTSTINGGASLILRQFDHAIIISDGTNYVALVCSLARFIGYQDGMINGTLSVSVASNAATFAIKTLAGSDPSAGDPVFVVFRNASTNAGDYVVLPLTAAASLIVSSGSTLGTANSVPFRIWIVGFNDGGMFRLGVINCVIGGGSPTQIFPLYEGNPQQSGTQVGGSSNSAGVFYTAGAAVTNKAFRILGYAEWNSGLTTAGTWNAGPGFIQLFGSGIKKPGEAVQQVYADSSTTDTTTSTSDQTSSLSGSITPSSAANLIKYDVAARAGANDSGNSAISTVFRGASGIGESQTFSISGASVFRVGASFTGIDAPKTNSAITYTVKYHSNTGGQTVAFGPGTMVLTELMT